jgi:hypothetical protein
MGTKRTKRQDLGVGIAVVLGAFAVWATTTYLAAIAVGYKPLETQAWGRWDTGWYQRIAREGYSLTHCKGVPLRTLDDYCGATAWFPGYPYSMRPLHALGLTYGQSGRIIAVVALLATFALLWFGFLARRPLRQALPAMALAAVFPGAVYYGAIFPISMLVAAMLGTLLLLQRRRWFLAGLCGAIATVAYSSGITIAIVAVVPLFTPGAGGFLRRVWAGFQIGLPSLAAYGLVLLDFERSVGRWDAWFLVQEGYGHELGSPWTTFWHRVDLLQGGSVPKDFVGTHSAWVGGQSLLVAVLVLAVLGIAAVRWRQLGPGERGAVVLTLPLWLVPLSLGDALSIYRAEAVMVPMVVVLARAPAFLQWLAAAVAAVVCYFIARLFFTFELI